MTESAQKQVIYIGDPMCSWCWGFSPALRKIREQFGDRVSLAVIVGGLRTGTMEAITDEMRAYIHHHWHEVNQRTGQPFSSDILDQPGFVYNTEPACRAVVAMRRLNPELVFDFFEQLHQAFYRDGMDLTRARVLADLAESLGVTGREFSSEFDSAQTAAETVADFGRARSLGVHGFPSVVLRDGDRHTLLTSGYQPFEVLSPYLDSWLAGTPAE